jgi:hypothetical protein
VADVVAIPYTADDFLSAANCAGLPRSKPWLRSLVRDGLLNQPDKHGVSGQRGGRAPGTWPRTQFQLFLALLDQMQKGVRQTATLCNIPVSIWLYFGPEYVPVRQVRRALGTYGAQYRTTSARRGRQTALRLALLFGSGPDMSRQDRDRLVGAVVSATRSGTFDRDLLIAAAGRIFDPERRGRTAGPDRARLSPEAWVRTIEARLTALDRVDGLDEQVFEDARLAQDRHLAEYIKLQPGFERDRETGAMFEAVTFEQLVNSACIDTLTILGFLELAREQSPTTPDQSAPRLREQPGAPARGGTAPHAEQHATARRRAGRGSPQRTAAS